MERGKSLESTIKGPQIDQLPSHSVLDEIHAKVNMQHLHDSLMEEGIAKFATPQKKLIETISRKRLELAK